jgi:hypothetical protein
MSTPPPDHSPLLGQAPAELSFRRRRFIFQVKNDILTAREPIFLKYESIEPSIGSRAALSLDSDGEIEARSVLINYNSVTRMFTVDMPAAIPSCHAWIIDEFIQAGVSGYLTCAENRDISMSSNTRMCILLTSYISNRVLCGVGFNTFAAPYQMSFAEPNLYLKPSGFPLPTVVFVSGFSQLYPYLLMQKDVWLIGGAAHVNIVFIVEWCQISQSRIEGRLEFWRKNQQGPETFVRISHRKIGPFGCLINSSFIGYFPASPSGDYSPRNHYQKG